MCSVKVLFLSSGPAWPSGNLSYTRKFESLSKVLGGYIITHSASVDLNVKRIGGFRFLPFHYRRGNALIRNSLFVVKSLFLASRLIVTRSSFDVIVVSDPLLSGFVGLLIAKIFRKKIIIEVNGNFEAAFKYDLPDGRSSGLMVKYKEKVSRFVIKFILGKADAIKLLYEKQLEPLGVQLTPKTKCFSFHDFVPVKLFFSEPKSDENFLLLVGHPWYLKGVDILIKAFREISSNYPGLRLKIVGWCPEGKDFFERLAEGNSNIELCEPVPYREVVSLMTQCSCYVLASRTEAMGRVLIEAMACAKPIVAANVGGVPSIIEDGSNGLLFEKQNVIDLIAKLEKIFTDKSLARSLGENGYKKAKQVLSEEEYVRLFKNMVSEVSVCSQ
jgi:glycosyltransferase involved in cell wall biosynthesis